MIVERQHRLHLLLSERTAQLINSQSLEVHAHPANGTGLLVKQRTGRHAYRPSSAAFEGGMRVAISVISIWAQLHQFVRVHIPCHIHQT